MTREEHISNLETIGCDGWVVTTDAYKSLQFAIKTLEQKPNEDCIARQPLIDNWNCCADMLMGEGDAEVVMGWIFDAPSVTPARKVGKWIKIGDRGFGWSDTVICKCSECEYKTEFRGKIDGQCLIVDQEYAHNYCPNCGAKMESEVEK